MEILILTIVANLFVGVMLGMLIFHVVEYFVENTLPELRSTLDKVVPPCYITGIHSNGELK